MFETAELGQTVDKATYESRVLELRHALLVAQGQLRQAGFPVVVLFAGVDKAGKDEMANLLNEWMDPRWISTAAFDRPTEDERERPRMWRFWNKLPPKGQMGILLSAWYSLPILDHVSGRTSTSDLELELAEIARFEQLLAADGALILKFWMHLGKAAQKHRLEALQSDPDTAWRVTDKDWANWKRYDRFAAAAERVVTHTGSGVAPWIIVDGTDARYRALRVGGVLLDAMNQQLAAAACPHSAAPPSTALQPVSVLSGLDLSHKISKAEYKERLPAMQGRLAHLQRRADAAGISTVLVFEGWDAGGKGGAIRRLTGALNAKDYDVVRIAAPTEEERAQHYLWRFWRRLPRAGNVAIFDRSWYGRVLVERIEGFATADEWQRAFAEINHFERQLVQHRIVLLKFWLHIDQDEQARRFDERAGQPHKAWKLTDEDWRNRERWPEYSAAVHDMVQRCSPRQAPWILVEGNDKRFARLKVLEAVSNALEAALSAAEQTSGDTEAAPSPQNES